MNVNAAGASQAYVEALKRAAEEQQPGGATATQGPSFAELVGDFVAEGVGATRAAETVSMQAAAKQVELVDVVTAVANAEVTLETVVAVRDQVINAYQDIIRMPI